MSTGNSPANSDSSDDYEPSWAHVFEPPLPAQRSSDSRYSCGNTPRREPMALNVEADHHQPVDFEAALNLDLIPACVLQVMALSTDPSETLELLYTFLTCVPDEAKKTLTFEDYKTWRAYLEQNPFKSEHLKEGVWFAAVLITIYSQGKEGIDVAGLSYGMPCVTVAWDDVTLALLDRMSPMTLRSGILQACAVLNGIGLHGECDLAKVYEQFRWVRTMYKRAQRVASVGSRHATRQNMEFMKEQLVRAQARLGL